MRPSGIKTPLPDEWADEWAFVSDPVERLLFEGAAETVFEADESLFGCGVCRTVGFVGQSPFGRRIGGVAVIPTVSFVRQSGS